MKCKCFCPDFTHDEFQGLDSKEFNLSGRTFYILKTPIISHFPVNPELKIQKALKEIEKKGFQPVLPLFIMFEDGLLMGSIMIEIQKTASSDSNIRTLETFKLIGKIFSGPKYLVPKALREFDSFLMSQNILTSNFYFWYHSCKECEKIKGSRTVILGKVVQSK